MTCRASRTSRPTSWGSATPSRRARIIRRTSPTAGGGEAYTQNDAAGLKAALEEIFAEVAQEAIRPSCPHGGGQRVQPHAHLNYAVRVRVRALQSRSLARQREEISARRRCHPWRHGGRAEPAVNQRRASSPKAPATCSLAAAGRRRGRDQGRCGGQPARLGCAQDVHLPRAKMPYGHDDKFTVANTDNHQWISAQVSARCGVPMSSSSRSAGT